MKWNTTRELARLKLTIKYLISCKPNNITSGANQTLTICLLIYNCICFLKNCFTYLNDGCKLLWTLNESSQSHCSTATVCQILQRHGWTYKEDFCQAIYYMLYSVRFTTCYFFVARPRRMGQDKEETEPEVPNRSFTITYV